MKILFETENEELTIAIQHWFEELKHRIYRTGLEFYSDDLVAIKNGPYIIVMANIVLTDYDNNLVPFQRRNVTIKHRETTLKPEFNYWSDDGRFLVSGGSINPTTNISVELMPIYRPDLIVMLNEDGTLFKDGSTSKYDLEKILADNEAKAWESRLKSILYE